MKHNNYDTLTNYNNTNLNKKKSEHIKLRHHFITDQAKKWLKLTPAPPQHATWKHLQLRDFSFVISWMILVA